MQRCTNRVQQSEHETSNNSGSNKVKQNSNLNCNAFSKKIKLFRV
jgi:hypothetical protein